MSAWTDAVEDILGGDIHAWWRLGASGHLDVSGNGRHLTAAGGITVGGAGSLVPRDTGDGATTFDGSDDYLTRAGWDHGTNYTIIAVVRTTATETRIINRDPLSGTNRTFQFGTAGGGVEFITFQAGTGNPDFAGSASAVNDGTPHLVGASCEWDGTTRTSRVYVDGQPDGTPSTAATAPQAHAGNAVVIGAALFGGSPNGPLLTGDADEIIIVGRKVTDEEWATLYAAGWVLPPEPVTEAADDITHEGATLNGTVDPNGHETVYWFEYGETVSYGTSIPVGEDGDAGDGDTPIVVDEAIAGLDPETVYHYRLVASNAGGTVYGDDETFETAEAPPPPPVRVPAARVTNEPVDDRLFLELIDSAGRKTRWAGDSPDVSGIPLGMKFGDASPGGFRDMTCALQRDPRRTWPDLNLIDQVKVYGRTAPLGRSAFEGEFDQFSGDLGDGMSIGVSAVGSQILLDDNENWKALYVALGFEGWGEAPLWRRAELAAAGFPQGKVPFSQGPGGLAWDVPNGSLPAFEFSEAWREAPAGIKVAKLGYRGARTGTFTSFEGPAICSTDAGAAPTGTHANQALTLDDTARTITLTAPVRRLFLRTLTTSSTNITTAHQQRYSRLAVYGDHNLTLRDIPGELPGVWGHDALAHMLSTAQPLINYTTGPDGSIAPAEDVVIGHLAFLDPGKVSDAILQLNAYYLRRFEIWENRTAWWQPWEAAALTWKARVQGGAHWAPAGHKAAGRINGVVVYYTDAYGQQRTAGPPNSGCDTESALLASDDPTNPYTQKGRRRWGKLQIDFPIALASNAIQVGYVHLAEARIPQRSGTLTVRPLGDGHVPQLEHPTIGAVPVWAARSGDYIELDGWPEPEPFRITEKDYTPDTKTAVFQLDSGSPRLSAIMERVGVRMVGTL